MWRSFERLLEGRCADVVRGIQETGSPSQRKEKQNTVPKPTEQNKSHRVQYALFTYIFTFTTHYADT